MFENRFDDHLPQGVPVIFIGTWWIGSMIWRYFDALRNKKMYESSTWFPTRFCKYFPLECIIWLIVAFYGIDVSIGGLSSPEREKHFQHLNLCIMLLMVPVAQILEFYKCTIVKGASYVCCIFVQLVLVIMLYFHDDIRFPVNLHIHRLFLINSSLILIFFILEAKNRNSLIMSLGRAFFITIMGGWNVAISLIKGSPYKEYKDSLPGWDLTTRENVFAATALFMLVLLITFIYTMCIFWIIGRKHRHLLYDENSIACNGHCSDPKSV